MIISRNNIAFMAIRSKLIRSRRTKTRSNRQYTSWTSQSTKTSAYAATLAKKKALAEKTSKKTTSASQTILTELKKNYTSMETAVENAMKHLKKLINTEESFLWGNEATEPKTEPEIDKIREEITEFTEYYNNLVGSLDEEGGTISAMYKKQLHNFVVSYKSKLEKIGITENKYDKLKLDKEKLQEAETENLKEVFQGEGSFADKILDQCEKIKDNVEANLKSLNSAAYSSLLSSYGNSGSRFNSKA